MDEYIQKKEGYGHLLLWLIRFCDLILINVFFFAAYHTFTLYLNVHEFSYDRQLMSFLLINLSYFITAAAVPIQTSTNIIYIDKVVKGALVFIVFFCVIITVSFAVFNNIENISLFLLVISYGLLILLYVLQHIFIRLILKSYRKKGYNHKMVVIVGSNESGKAIYNELEYSDFGYKVKGYFDDDDSFKIGMPEYLGRFDDIQEYVIENEIDEIYCAITDNKDNRITNLIVFSERNMIRFFLIPEFFNYIRRKFVLRFVDSVPIVSLRYEPLQHLPNRLIKRTFDILFSLFILLVFLPPIFIVVSLLIKKSSPGPLFFRQKRTGFHGESFYCYKFRSMTVNKDADKQRATVDDPRITEIGKFIRKTSIDELPQFFNVLKGDMSIVGPRPHMLKHTEEYARLIDKFMVRHLVKPGITGWAQVSGFRGETKTLQDMEGRVKKDVWYIENWSFLLDIRIVYKTVFNVFAGEDKAY